MINEVGQGRMLAGLEQTARSVRWSARVCVLVIVPALSVSSASLARAQSPPRRASDERQLEQTQREEGEAILALADAAMAGKPVPSDFRVQWRNDFVKAQRGTFVPFTLIVDSTELNRRLALVYVRATRRSMLSSVERPVGQRQSDASRDRTDREESAYPVDAIFPVELGPARGEASRISRGFSVTPGEYDVFVVMRERVDPSAPARGRKPRW